MNVSLHGVGWRVMLSYNWLSAGEWCCVVIQLTGPVMSAQWF